MERGATAVDWESAIADWPQTPGHRLLRAYADVVNGDLVDRWLRGRPAAALLKTDLFDEAVGTGLYPRLVPLARRVEGIDLSGAVIQAARSRYPALDARQADVRDLPFADGEFDAIVSCSTLDHFEARSDIAVALGELARVLAPNGTLFVSLDNLANPLVALRNALPYSWLHRIGLVPHYVGASCRPAELERLLAEQGLEVRATTAVMHVPRLAALALGRSVEGLLAFERLGGLPTRYVTGQFVAALAVKTR
jgi:ubiquinone/menaquinone biosynthesis C-methylase UbiE